MKGWTEEEVVKELKMVMETSPELGVPNPVIITRPWNR